jgi:hypothetical protein
MFKKEKNNEMNFKRFILFLIWIMGVSYLIMFKYDIYPFADNELLNVLLHVCVVFLLPLFIMHCIDVLFYGEDWNIFKTESSNVDPDLFLKEARKVFKDIKKLQDEGVLPKGLKTMGEVQDYLNERKILDEDEDNLY